MGSPLQRLFQRLRKGDQSAFLPFYEKTAPGLLRFLLWKTRGDKPLAEDILQESFVRFLVSLDRLKSDQDVAIQAYLMQIVKNCLIDKAVRAPHTSRPHVPLENAMHLTDPFESLRQERAVEMRELQIAMSALPERDSDILWMRDGLGLSHREVAQDLGITEEASRQAYVRAKKNLLSGLKTSLGLASEGEVYAAT